MTDFGLYLVMTDPLVGYEKLAETAVGCGVRVIQLRMKHARRGDVLNVARAVRRVTDVFSASRVHSSVRFAIPVSR